MKILKCRFELRTTNLAAFILIPFIIINLMTVCYGGDENIFVPWDYNTVNPEHENISRQETDISFGASLLIGAVGFYQSYISPVNGERCPMIPTCSAYAVQAIKKHGFFIGIMMTADRLIHESDEIRYAPMIINGDKVSFHDPVSNNDFWFDRENSP